MGFLKRDDPPDTGVRAGQPAAAEAADAPHAREYRAGSLEGLPESGRERLERMKQDIQRGFFTSDLSVNEFLLVKEAGFEPLGLVLGSSIYHIGFQQAMWNQSMEMTVLTQAMYHARELAMTRMEEEADQLGADGIVGVRLTIGRYDWGADLAEFIAVGTAVKHAGGELHRAPGGRPFTSDLNGQDFSTLLRAGYRPVGLVMGNCVYHVARQGMMASLRQVGRNVEMTNFTQALYEARELAMGRMQAEADALQAGGLVGVQLKEASHGWGSHVIEFFAVATAVVPTQADHTIEKPTLVLPLTG
ncbi:MAG TPA: heavy metal-binding domain-containing protein [Solirubrobacteraceae bacterium]|nr:heavy metal-binding domain-containing protein [Solirubrobacteraceae bacterium]